MKLYLKVNSLKILENLEFLIRQRYTLFGSLVHRMDMPVEYRANIESLKVLNENMDIFYEPEKKELKKLVKGIYFGNDSCEHLLPDDESIKKAFDYCIDRKWNFVLTLPPLSEGKMKHLQVLLNSIRDTVNEVVVNDYGTLDTVLEAGLKPIFGVFFTKKIKPAFLDKVSPKSLDKHRSLMEHIEAEVREFREFLKEIKIGRISIDNQPIDTAFLKEKPYLYLDYYYPYKRISYSRACNIAGLFSNIQSYFPVDSCGAYCKHVVLNSRDKCFELFQSYNSFFTVDLNLHLDKNIIKNKKNRLIYEIFI